MKAEDSPIVSLPETAAPGSSVARGLAPDQAARLQTRGQDLQPTDLSQA